jgi:hypothetical protein
VVSKSSTREYLAAPSRQPPTPTDAVVSYREVKMLQFVYALPHKHPAEDYMWQTVAQRFLAPIKFSYGLSIQCHSIRQALLACGGSYLFANGHSQYEDIAKDYATQGSRLLLRKNSSSFGEEEFYTAFFLSYAEYYRFRVLYFQSNRNLEEVATVLSDARMRLAVHVRGSFAILDHLLQKNVPMSGVFKEFYPYAMDFLAYFIGFVIDVNIPALVEIARSYRVHRLCKAAAINPLHIDGSSASETSQWVISRAASSVLFGLARTILAIISSCAHDQVNSDWLKDGVAELKAYQDYGGADIVAVNETYIETPVTTDRIWYFLQWMLMERRASTLILFLFETFSEHGSEISEGFIYAKELITRALYYYESAKSSEGYVAKGDEQMVARCIGLGALIVPPVDDVERKQLQDFC